MSKTRKLIIYICAISALLIISIFTIRLVSDNHYGNQIPALPDFSNISTPLKEQIYAANKDAHNHPDSDNLGNLGMVYHSGGYYDEASQCYRLAIKRNRKNRIWSYYLGFIKLELIEYKSAIEYFNNVIEEDPTVYLALFHTGEAFQSLNSIDTAENIFTKIAGMNEKDFIIRNTSRTVYFPLPVFAKYKLARIYMNTNRFDPAEKQLKEIISDHITFGQAYRQLGNLYTIKGDSALSRYYFLRANDLTVSDTPADTLIDKLSLMSRSDIFLMKQIDLAIRNANSELAVELLIIGLKYYPENKYLISKAINQFFNTGLNNLVLPYLDRHIQYFSDDFTELLKVGSQLSDAGMKAQALRYFLAAANLKNQSAEERSVLALRFFEKGGIKEYAIKLITEELERNPKNLKVLGYAIYLYLQMNDKEMAGNYLDKLKHLSPSNPDTKIFAGMAAEQEGNLKEAIVLYEQALILKPDDLVLLEHLGNIYLLEKMWSRAIGLFRKGLEFHPNNSNFQGNLGALLVTCPDEKLRNIPEGREYSERAFINCVYTPQIRITAGRNLAIAYDELGDRRKASLYIKMTIDLARKVHASKDYIKSLENLSKEFSTAK